MAADGTWQWVRQAGGTGFDGALSVAALSDGSAILTGWFNGTATFGSTTLISAGAADIFVGKVSATGAWQWIRQAGGTGSDSALSVAALSDGSAILTGDFNGTATFAPRTIAGGSYSLTSAGSGDIFVAKVSADGYWQWATGAGGTAQERGNAVSVFSDGSSIVTGWFNGTVTFGSTTLTSAGGTDIFVAKVSPTGVWG
jgi:hypothetical protein